MPTTAEPPMSALPGGQIAPQYVYQYPVKGAQYALTTTVNLDEPEMEPEMVRQGKPTPPDTGAPDFLDFCCWVFSCCGLYAWCFGDEDGSAESVMPEPVSATSAAPVKMQKMQGSPLMSSQGKGKNMSVFKQQRSIQQQQQQFRSTSAQGAYY